MRRSRARTGRATARPRCIAPRRRGRARCRGCGRTTSRHRRPWAGTARRCRRARRPAQCPPAATTAPQTPPAPARTGCPPHPAAPPRAGQSACPAARTEARRCRCRNRRARWRAKARSGRCPAPPRWERGRSPPSSARLRRGRASSRPRGPPPRIAAFRCSRPRPCRAFPPMHIHPRPGRARCQAEACGFEQALQRPAPRLKRRRGEIAGCSSPHGAQVRQARPSAMGARASSGITLDLLSR